MDKLGGKEQVLRGVVRNIVGDGVVPDALLRGGKSGLRFRRDVQCWSGGLGAFVGRRGGSSRASFVIEGVMEIDPEAAVKLEDGKRSIAEIVL